MTVIGALVIESWADMRQSGIMVRLKDAEKYVERLVTDEEMTIAPDILALKEQVVTELCAMWGLRFRDVVLPNGRPKEGHMWSFAVIPYDPGFIDGEVVNVTYPDQKAITDGSQ